MRVQADSGSGGGVLSAAFRNANGSVVVELLNTTASTVPVSVSLRDVPGGLARPYLTDAADQVTPQPGLVVHGGHFSTSAPPRSVVTVVLPAA